MSETPEGQQPPRLATPWPEIFLAALVAGLHAVVLLGRIHPDEVFQSLEPALHRAFGYGVLAWEWQVPPEPMRDSMAWGIRNWAVPGLFALLLKGASAIGVDGVLGRRVVVAIPQLCLHAAMLGAVWRFSVRRAGADAARWSTWLVALYGPIVWFGCRTLSESFSVAFLVWGLERLDAEDPRPLQNVLAGVLLGFAQITRYPSAAVIAPAMLWLLVTRRWRAFGWATLGGLAVALALGLLDRMTWGEWFHSFRTYVQFNVLSKGAAQQFGELPFWYYFQRLYLAPWAVIGLALWWKRLSTRGWLFVAAGAGYFVILSATAHKEDRFLYPTLVLLTIAGTPAFVQWALEAFAQKRAAARAAAVLLVLGNVAFFLAPSPFAPQRKEQFQLEVKASRGATGLVMMNEGMWGSGGYFYAGGNIPWCPCDFPHDQCFQVAAHDARFNRGLYWSNGNEAEKPRDAASIQAFLQAGFRLVEQRGQASYFERP